MRFVLLLFVISLCERAQGQVGSVASTCIWSGTVADCLPSAGILLRDQRDVRFGEASGSGTNYVALQGPTTLGGDITLTLPTDDGTSASQWMLTDASGNLSFSDTTTIAKTIDGSADAIQLTVQGNATQTSNILVVEKSDGTDLLMVTNTEGTDILGTTSNDAACTGCVGEKITTTAMSNTSLNTSATDVTGSSLVLSAGNWQIFYAVTGSVTTGSSASNATYIDLAVYTSGNTLLANTDSRLYCKTVAAVANLCQSMLVGSNTVQLSGSTTYKLRGARTDDAGTGSAVIDAPGSKFYAVRIR